MLLHELIPACARRFKLGGGGRKRAIIGWSMGAYGALVAAETEPDLFAAVVAVSPAVWTSYDAMMLGPQDAFDDAADFAKYDVIAHADRLAGVDLRIDCGKQDPFYGYVTYSDGRPPEARRGRVQQGRPRPRVRERRWRPPRRGSSGGRSGRAGPDPGRAERSLRSGPSVHGVQS